MDRAQIEAFLADLYERTPGKGLTPDQRRDQLMAFLAGGADAGGLGSGALEMAGAPGAAKALTDAKGGAEGAASLGEAANPLSIISTLYGGVKDIFTEGPDAPTLKTRDQFFQERRKPVQSVGEAKAAARERAMNSAAYKQAVSEGATKRAERIAAAAERSAEDALKKDAANAGTADAAIGADYEAYLKDYDRDLEAFHGQSFADRNPGLAKALPVAGTLGAALLTRGLLGRMGKKTAAAADEVIAARSAGDPARLAEARAAADAAQPGKLKVAGAYGAGAAVPVEAQMAADLIDKKGLPSQYQDSSGEWQPVLAQERASKRLDPYNNFGAFAEHNATALLSGGVGALTGGKLAGPMTPVPRQIGADDYGKAVEEIVGGINAQKAVATARQPDPAIASVPPAPASIPAPPPALPGTGSPVRAQSRQATPGGGQPLQTYGAPQNRDVRSMLADLLDEGKVIPAAPDLANMAKSAVSGPAGRMNIPGRARGTANEADALQRLGVNIYDPALRKQILDKIAPGTAGMLSVGGLANSDIEALLAEIMGGGG